MTKHNLLREGSRQAARTGNIESRSSGRRIPVRSFVFAVCLLAACVLVSRDVGYSSALFVTSDLPASTHATGSSPSSPSSPLAGRSNASNGKTPSLPASPLLWDQMSSAEEQEAAYQRVKPYLKTHAAKIRGRERKKKHGNCTVAAFGTGWGSHELCDFTVPNASSCAFVSFGISNDYTFDTDLANKKKCRGIAADPTIVHPSQLHPLVTFHNFGAKTLYPNEEKKKDEREWWSISVPALRKLLDIPRIHVLKMDCEGCEYSIARDVLMEDPTFFQHVDQLSLEVHVSKEWINSKETLYYFGLLFQMLEENGLILQKTFVASCNKYHEAAGCMDELKAIGYPCGNKRSCHDYLFAKA